MAGKPRYEITSVTRSDAALGDFTGHKFKRVIYVGNRAEQWYMKRETGVRLLNQKEATLFSTGIDGSHADVLVHRKIFLRTIADDDTPDNLDDILDPCDPFWREII